MPLSSQSLRAAPLRSGQVQQQKSTELRTEEERSALSPGYNSGWDQSADRLLSESRADTEMVCGCMVCEQ